MIALMVMIALIQSARAEESAADGGPCATIPGDRSTGLKTAGGLTAQSCRDQIKTSFDACVKDPEVTDEEKQSAFSYADVQAGGPSLYQKQTAAWTEGYGRYSSAVELCRRERQKITDACTQGTNDLKAAMKAEAQADPASTKAFGAGVQSKATTQAVLQTQQQVDATTKAQTTALRTIDNQVTCLQGQADALQAAVQKLQQNSVQETQVGAVTATNSVNVTAGDSTATSTTPTASTGSTTPSTPAINQPKPLWQIYQSSEAQDIAATGLGAVPVVGPTMAVGYAAKGGDWAGATQSTAGLVDAAGLVGEGAFAETVGTLGGPVGLFAVTVAAPTATQSGCFDTSAYDPAALAKGGCSGIPSVSTSSLKSTVATLNAP